MSENHETRWEDLSNGQRVELGLVQIDIVGHSRIVADPSTLKKAKDIFSDEMAGIAAAHGGALFKWEGDGGSFKFHTRKGKVFNELVGAALEMLDSMPAINQKIAGETGLSQPFHIRLSCDTGIVEYDQDPPRISADFLNRFLKNERKISLADNVCITERVYKQLDAQLRSRFRPYKYSFKVRSRIYSLPRRKFPLRWRHLFLSGLIGTALGLICAAILAGYGLWFQRETIVFIERETVVFTGGGTVYTYLTAIDPNIFKNLGDDAGINVLALRAPTDIGASQFAHGFDQAPVLAMASRQLEYKKLSRPVPGQSKDNPRSIPEAVFEVYLGADTLKMLLVVGNEHARDVSALDKDFGDILQHRSFSINGEQELPVAKLAKVTKWTNDQHNVYGAMPGSGTISLWEEVLKGKDGKLGAYPPHINSWDIQINGFIDKFSDKPNIYLGSEILITAKGEEGINNPKEELFILDESGKRVTRGLYLYGFLDISDNNKKTHGEAGFYLPKHVTKILKYVFVSLKNSPQKSSINAECLTDQWKYFHLDGEVGWVRLQSEGTHIYRIVTCKGRPPR